MNISKAFSRRYKTSSSYRRASQKGASLIEVLVAVLLLSFGIVGMAGMQFASTKFNHSAYLRSQGTSLAYDLADRARANLDACPVTVPAVPCVYETTLATAFDGVAAQACGQPLATTGASDVNQWKSCVESALPDGQGRSLRLAANTAFVDQCNTTHAATAREVFVVEVNWNDGRLQAGANARDCAVVRTVVRPL